MKRIGICLILLSLLATGCAIVQPYTSSDHSMAVVVTASSTVPDLPSTTPIPEIYEPHPQDVSVEAMGVTIPPEGHAINAMTIQPGGGGLCGDFGGWMPGDTSVNYDLETVRRMAAEESPLLHDGTLRVLVDGKLRNSFGYTIHNGNSFEKVSGDGYQICENDILHLPKEDGVFFVNLLISWTAAETYPGEEYSAYETWQYVFPVRYTVANGN